MNQDFHHSCMNPIRIWREEIVKTASFKDKDKLGHNIGKEENDPQPVNRYDYWGSVYSFLCDLPKYINLIHIV